MEVAEHFVGLPAPNEADDVGVDARAKEGHGATRAETAGGDAVGVEVERVGGRGGGDAQGLGNGVTADGHPSVGFADHI